MPSLFIECEVIVSILPMFVNHIFNSSNTEIEIKRGNSYKNEEVSG